MTTFKAFRIIKLLLESPMVDSNITPEMMHSGADGIKHLIKTNHNSSNSLGDDEYHLNQGKSDIYYHHINGEPEEISYINNGVQTGVMKGNGSVDHIHNFMRQHIVNNGILMSDKSNTTGSKNLWTNFIKKNKDLKFSIYNTNTKDEYNVDHSNIDDHVDKIWGNDDKFKDIRVIAEK